ncbi:MAG TPA: DUF6599 family protein, partial [Pyrinomonadaceae bacterium]
MQSKLVVVLFALFSILLAPSPSRADVSPNEAAKMLPDKVGEHRARAGPANPDKALFEQLKPEDFRVVSAATRTYDAGHFTVTLVETRSDSAAYALLTEEARQMSPPQAVRPAYVGTAGMDSLGGVTFVKGAALVHVYMAARESGNKQAVLDFARLFADTLDKGEGEIPVLTKHLPDWEKTQGYATYSVSLGGLQRIVGNQPVLDAISFEGGAEAVSAVYGQSRLVVVEYTTPQIASNSDASINERIRQLREAGQPLPSAYRRVGNYSVFVFDAPDEKTAQQLIDQVSYEQVVQWLGTNPHWLERAQRQYTQKTASVIVAVLKASGLSLVLCFGVGALAGGLVFVRRRRRQASVEAYSDAGGMLRLNLDEM